MNFLSFPNNQDQNTFLKPHNNNNTFVLSETPSKTAFGEHKHTQLADNNNLSPNGHEKTLKELWSKHKSNMNKSKNHQLSNLDNVNMTWKVEKTTELFEETDENTEEKLVEKKHEQIEEEEHITKEESPSHHARRPPNAFLIFCKKHRPIVRDRFPNLENRGVTKILGEWWALLNSNEKQSYNDLAREYKDAFLSANPDFRWYKLPAPPLRTLSTRPMTVVKTQPPVSSPSNSTPPEFTPGKLADESQLGGLTSLMNNFTTVSKIDSEDNNNTRSCVHKIDASMVSPVSNINVSTPPKPIKKRFVEYFENKGCARNILGREGSEGDEANEREPESLRNQDLMNKVVDGFFPKSEDDLLEKNGSKEVRKSERMCKGKRYELFMLQGRLLGNKRDAKIPNQKNTKLEAKAESESIFANNNNNNKPETPKLDLENTIKRLAERTNIKIDFGDHDEKESPNVTARVRSISETSEGSNKSSPPNFNLDLRITNLPSLSYDEFLRRKRDSKKRKISTKTDGNIKFKVQKTDHKADSQLVGSKKRKNKQSITHLGKKDDNSLGNDLLGLATLAEVAANTEKINEKISE